jgi:hypothetical protein
MSGSGFDAELGQLYIEGEKADLLGGLNFVGFQTSKLVKDGRAVARTIRPKAVASDGNATDWESFSRLDLQTENEDFVVGATGTVEFRVRNVGTTRCVRIAIRFGASPDVGTGSLQFPLNDNDTDIAIDPAQMFSVLGTPFGPDGRSTIVSAVGGLVVGSTVQGIDDRHILITDQATVVDALGAPSEGMIWLVSFDVPVMNVDS